MSMVGYEFIIGYIIVAVVWAACCAAWLPDFMVHKVWKLTSHPLDSFDWVMGTLMGCISAIIWPVVLSMLFIYIVGAVLRRSTEHAS